MKKSNTHNRNTKNKHTNKEEDKTEYVVLLARAYAANTDNECD